MGEDDKRREQLLRASATRSLCHSACTNMLSAPLVFYESTSLPLSAPNSAFPPVSRYFCPSTSASIHVYLGVAVYPCLASASPPQARVCVLQ